MYRSDNGPASKSSLNTELELSLLAARALDSRNP